MSNAPINGTKILVMGPEIRNQQHRGLYIYKKSLFAALKHLGLTTGFLTQTYGPGEPKRLLAQIVHSLANPAKFEWSRGRTAWLKSEYKSLARDIRNELSTADPKWRFLSNVDYFFNAPAFFDALDFANTCSAVAPKDLVARLSTHLKRRSGEVRDNAVDVDFVADAGYGIVITSSPTPIHSNSGRVRIIQTVHDLIPFEYPLGTDDPGAFLNALAPALLNADFILAISKYTLATLTSIFPEHAAKCIAMYQANPIEPMLERVPQNSSLHDKCLKAYDVEKQKYFFYVGAIEKRKNIEVLVRAFLMLDRSLGLKLLLSGPIHDPYVRETGLADYFQSQQARSDGVLYAGYIPDEQKVALLRNASALVFPSLLEGFGLPVLEAMSVGCPVITTRCSSLPEVGADATLYVEDPFDACELSTLMQRLATDQGLSTDLHDRGLLRANAFTIRAFAERLGNWGQSKGLFRGDMNEEHLLA